MASPPAREGKVYKQHLLTKCEPGMVAWDYPLGIPLQLIMLELGRAGFTALSLLCGRVNQL